ncbi:hypothetical protein F4823DRAFT_557867 [Ustulina deusta]|nr:hypothetical protein F4823DRAFT_557867 [Ustulina deusta]
MLALPSARTQAWGPWGLHRLFLALFLSFLVHPSQAYLLPPYFTDLASRRHTSAPEAQARNPATFSRDFATAMGAAVAVVVTGATLICVFAHCWRQILDRSRSGRDEAGRAKRRAALLGDEEAWFCRANRRLPKPPFGDTYEYDSGPVCTFPMAHEPDEAVPDPCYGYKSPTANERRATMIAWLGSKGLLGSQGAATLLKLAQPEKQACSEKIEGPASVACLLDCA